MCSCTNLIHLVWQDPFASQHGDFGHVLAHKFMSNPGIPKSRIQRLLQKYTVLITDGISSLLAATVYAMDHNCRLPEENVWKQTFKDTGDVQGLIHSLDSWSSGLRASQWYEASLFWKCSAGLLVQSKDRLLLNAFDLVDSLIPGT